MQPPGYGLSDLALIIKIAIKLRQAYNRAPDQYQSLAREGLGLEFAIKQSYKSLLKHPPSDEHQALLFIHIGTTRTLLQKVDEKLHKYCSLGTNDNSKWDRLLFDKGDVKELREEIGAHQTALYRFQTDVNSTTLADINQKLNELVKDKAEAGGITSTPSDVVARDLTDKLASKGIAKDFISNHESLIINLIVDFFKEQGYSLDSDTEVDPLSPVVRDEKLPENLAEIEGDDQAIVTSWADSPDWPPILASGVFTRDRSLRSNSIERELPTLAQTNSTRPQPSVAETGKSSLRSKFESIGWSSMAHLNERDVGYFDSSKCHENPEASCTDSLPLPKESVGEQNLHQQISTPSQGSPSFNRKDSTTSSSQNPGNQTGLARSNTNPTARMSSASAAIPRTVPSRHNSLTAIEPSTWRDQTSGRRASETSSSHESASPRSKRRISSSSVAGSTCSSPKSGFIEKISKLGDSHAAE